MKKNIKNKDQINLLVPIVNAGYTQEEFNKWNEKLIEHSVSSPTYHIDGDYYDWVFSKIYDGSISYVVKSFTDVKYLIVNFIQLAKSSPRIRIETMDDVIEYINSEVIARRNKMKEDARKWDAYDV